MNIDETITTARGYQQAGQIEAAEQIYRQILELQPAHADALHLLGVASYQKQQFEDAAKHIRRAIEVQPDRSEFHTNLGNVFQSQQQYAAASTCYQRALELKPQGAEALNNLGAVLLEQGEYEKVVAYYQKALPVHPEHPEMHKNLATAYHRLGRLADASASMHQVVRLRPQDVIMLNYAGNLQQMQGHHQDAEPYYRQAVQVKPDFAEAHYNLGNALLHQGRHTQAEACYARTLELQPSFLGAYQNLGLVLKNQGKFDEAAACYKKALAVDADNFEFHLNLGHLYKEQGDMPQAEVSYRQALHLQPDNFLLKVQLASLCPQVVRDGEQIDFERNKLREELRRLQDLPKEIELANLPIQGTEPPFTLQYHGRDNREIKEAFAGLFRDCFDQPELLPRGATPRIGIVVTDQHQGVFLRLLADNLRRMRKEAFELVVFCSNPAFGRVRDDLPSGRIGICTMPDRFDLIVQTILDARCDVLYYWEVGTDANNYFLPFFRLAPVQCTSWAVQETTGIPTMDYYLSSSLIEPEDAASHYTETLICSKTLPAYQPPHVPDAKTRRKRDAFGMPADKHLYMCHQRPGKIHPDFDSILGQILHRDPQGLVAITENRYALVARQLQQRFAQTLPEVHDRIVFVPRQSTHDYLCLLAASDVLLDTLYYGGVCTTYDGLAQGKPIVTRPSEFQRGRYTYGCYQKMELNDCVAKDNDDYVDIAVRLGTDADYRTEVENKIREAGPLLFNDTEAVHEHERIFEELVEKARSTPQ